MCEKTAGRSVKNNDTNQRNDSEWGKIDENEGNNRNGFGYHKRKTKSWRQGLAFMNDLWYNSSTGMTRILERNAFLKEESEETT